jgi:hypothetical protein
LYLSWFDSKSLFVIARYSLRYSFLASEKKMPLFAIARYLKLCLAPTNLASGVTWPRDSGFRYLRSAPRNLSTPQGKDQSPQKTSLIGKWKLSHLRWLLPPKLGEIMRLQLGHSTHFVAPLLTGNTGGRYPHQRRPRT